jgi:prepilin-type N-terminal cleavage/methylation domain-containing protein
MRTGPFLAKRIGRGGFSIVELLIVITIIGILIAAMTPAIQSSREAARKLQCMNNLKQLALGVTNHLNSYGYFPSGGWGYLWVGDPDRGFGSSQPGGWIFSILPFIEENTLWNAGAGIDFSKNPDAKKTALLGQVNKPISLLYCPTRRDAQIFPWGLTDPVNLNFADLKPGVLKTDYAINVGDSYTTDAPGPPSVAVADSGNYEWIKTTGFTGISCQRSQVTAQQVTDGFGHTYMIGEKNVNPLNYTVSGDVGDNEAATEGFDDDNSRGAGPGNEPVPDTLGESHHLVFGSAHVAGFHMAFCDGSVHMIEYNIDPDVHSHLANRADGQTISSDSIH